MHRVIEFHDSLITGPTLEPLDLEEVKKALRFTATSEDTLLDVWIAAARQHFEEQTGRQCVTATWERWLDAFPCQASIELPHPPLQAVGVSVTYLDASGEEQTLDEDSYQVIAPAGPTCGRGRIALVYGAMWPTTIQQERAVRIQFRAGYGDAPGAVPELVKGALYFLVGHFHRYRSEGTDVAVTTLPLGAEMLLRSFRQSAIGVQEPLRAA